MNGTRQDGERRVFRVINGYKGDGNRTNGRHQRRVDEWNKTGWREKERGGGMGTTGQGTEQREKTPEKG